MNKQQLTKVGPPMAKQKVNITGKHRHALTQVLESFGERRFRRSDLSACIYPLTTPRNRERADAISERVLRDAATEGRIRREGHQHWIKVGQGRSLLDGSVVAELPVSQSLVLNTKCPQKWLAVDMETGDVWRGAANGWKRVAGERSQEIADLLSRSL